MKLHVILLLLTSSVATTAAAQLTPATPTTWTQSDTNIAALIAADAKKAQVERWKILSETQTKIFEIQQDVTVNRAKTNLRTYEAFDQYIRSGSDPVKVHSPEVRSSGRITIAPASSSPPTSEQPEISYLMKVILNLIPGSSGNASSFSSLWESDSLTTSAHGFGSFDFDLTFADPGFSFTLNPDDVLQVQTIFNASYDTTNVTSDDVRFVIDTGGAYAPSLPETSLSLVVTSVPEPAGLSGILFVLRATGRRRA